MDTNFNNCQYRNLGGPVPGPWIKDPVDVNTGSSSGSSGSAGTAPVAPGGSGLEGAGEASEWVGNLLDSLLGGGRLQPQPNGDTTVIDVNTGDQLPNTKPKSNLGWWIAGGVVGVSLLGVIIWRVTKK